MGKKTGNLKREFSAGGAVYKQTENKVEWLLMQPAGTSRWQLPKGTIDTGERAEEAAVREVFEETGVKARVLDKIETIQYFYRQGEDKIFKTVKFFLMEYVGGEPTFDGKETDKVGWFFTKEAVKKLTFAAEQKILEKGERLVGLGIQEKLV